MKIALLKILILPDTFKVFWTLQEIWICPLQCLLCLKDMTKTRLCYHWPNLVTWLYFRCDTFDRFAMCILDIALSQFSIPTLYHSLSQYWVSDFVWWKQVAKLCLKHFRTVCIDHGVSVVLDSWLSSRFSSSCWKRPRVLRYHHKTTTSQQRQLVCLVACSGWFLRGSDFRSVYFYLRSKCYILPLRRHVLRILVLYWCLDRKPVCYGSRPLHLHRMVLELQRPDDHEAGCSFNIDSMAVSHCVQSHSTVLG